MSQSSGTAQSVAGLLRVLENLLLRISLPQPLLLCRQEPGAVLAALGVWVTVCCLVPLYDQGGVEEEISWHQKNSAPELLWLLQEFPAAAELQIAVTTPLAMPRASSFPQSRMKAAGAPRGCTWMSGAPNPRPKQEHTVLHAQSQCSRSAAGRSASYLCFDFSALCCC